MNPVVADQSKRTCYAWIVREVDGRYIGAEGTNYVWVDSLKQALWFADQGDAISAWRDMKSAKNPEFISRAWIE